jgi:DNA repair exonuclease SbcCD ATPase subunit
MSSFFRRSKGEVPEVRQATEAEVAERAARLRALDEEIERRNGQLEHPRDELTQELEPENYAEPEQAPPPVETSDNGAGSRVDEQLAGIEQVLRETVSALAARVDAVEMSLQETQRQSAEALVAAPAPLDESIEARLAHLEAGAGPTATDVDRLSALAARVEALETGLQETQRRGVEELRAEQELVKELLEHRLSELEAAAAERQVKSVEELRGEQELVKGLFEQRLDALETSLQETQRKSVEELRVEQELIKELLEQRLSGLEATAAEAARSDDRVFALAARVDALETSLQEIQRKSVEQEPLERRIAALDAATSEASRSNQAIETRLGGILEQLSNRVESIDTRLAATEHSASVSDTRLRTMAESILDRASDQPPTDVHD